MPIRTGFSFLAGDPALDLVNTVAWRGDPARTTDRLDGFAALAEWSRRAGVIDPPAAARLSGGDAEVAQVRDLREALHAVAGAVADGREPEGAPLRALNERIVAALAAATPREGLPLAWEVEVARGADLPHALALAALRLLRSPDVLRVGRCSDPVCGWLYLDHSRNRSRRWCSSADCGNRDRVRRHHARTAGGGL